MRDTRAQQPEQTFSSGLPFFELRGNQPDDGLGVEPQRQRRALNCPLAQNEKQWQAVGNVPNVGNHTIKFGIDIRRAYNLRVPSDSHRSGSCSSITSAPAARHRAVGWALADLHARRCDSPSRYVSTSIEARERQWRHPITRRTPGASNPKLTLNYGLRLDVINPQTVNEPGNGTWVDLSTGQGLVGGIGNIDLAGNVENRLNWGRVSAQRINSMKRP